MGWANQIVFIFLAPTLQQVVQVYDWHCTILLLLYQPTVVHGQTESSNENGKKISQLYLSFTLSLSVSSSHRPTAAATGTIIILDLRYYYYRVWAHSQ